MELYLLRHGHANPFAASDSLRELSDRGRAEVQSIISAQKDQLASLDAVWVSPYVRAQQTWALASGLLSCAPTAITEQAITPDGQRLDVIDKIEQSGASRLLLVTHQPFVGDLLDALCGFEPGRHFMGTANLAAISLPLVARGLGELQWHRQPCL